MNQNVEFKEIFSSYNERGMSLIEFLPETDDVTLITLKGHLIIERMLYLIVTSHCNYPEYIDDARLSFAQLTNVAKALVNLPIHEKAFPAITRLNRLRNELAHNIDSNKIEKLAMDFVVSCGNEIDEEQGLAAKIRKSICYLLGALTAFGAVSKNVGNTSNKVMNDRS